MDKRNDRTSDVHFHIFMIFYSTIVIKIFSNEFLYLINQSSYHKDLFYTFRKLVETAFYVSLPLFEYGETPHLKTEEFVFKSLNASDDQVYAICWHIQQFASVNINVRGCVGVVK
uniref:Uncharacterized protein n=1 Tax=Glossina pallidipes TaxID=7398 RepID=A0A1A9Z5W6_GLOPL